MSASHKSQESGFASLVLLLVVLSATGLVISNFIPVSRHYSDGKSNVQGVMLARDGGFSGGPGDSGGPGGGDNHSGSNGSGDSHSSNPAPAPVTAQAQTVATRPVNATTTQPKPLPPISAPTSGDSQQVSQTREQEVETLDKELSNDGVKLATAPGKLAVVQGRSGAVVPFPLSVDPTTHALTVTTPAGTKTVAVLPDQALKNLQASKVLDNINSSDTSSSLASITDVVQMKEENGVLGYEVQGVKDHNFLGIKFTTPVTAFVSAENGQVVDTQTSLLGRILSRLPF